jgi:hypothetical protein
MLDRYWLDAAELVMNEDYVDALDDAALSQAVSAMASSLAHAAQD